MLIQSLRCCLVVLALTLGACSGDEGEKGAVDAMTDKAAQEAVNYVREPINEADAVRDLSQNRVDDMAKDLK